MYEGYPHLGIMPADIVQWCAEIGNFNGYLHCVIIKLKLNFLNIISKVSQLIAFILWTILIRIFNINATFYSLTIFAVFPFSPVVLKFTIDYLCLWFKLSQLICNQLSFSYYLNIIKTIIVVLSGYFLHLLLLQHGDIESNPGPRNNQIKNLSCCHWNVNSLLAQNFSKVSQIEAYNSLYNHDFICISETYFDSSVLDGDGYNLIRADHPSNAKRGGVCIYYKESLGVRVVKLSNLSQCIMCEVSVQNCKGYIGAVYRSPSQNNIEFENFLSDFEELLSKTVFFFFFFFNWYSLHARLNSHYEAWSYKKRKHEKVKAYRKPI